MPRILLTTLCFAATLAAAEPRVTNAVLGLDKVEKDGGYEIAKPTNTFFPDTPKIVCVFKIEGASVGTSLNSVWIAENVGEAAPPNYKIAEKKLTLPFMNSGEVSLSMPDAGWPTGSYRLELYLGDKLVTTVRFNVEPE